jgi:predicted  nucleic acid-binding Zn-ribbon protein
LSSKVAEQIKALREIQEVDRQIREIERAKTDLPQKRAGVRAARERERADIDASKALVGKNDEERRRLEKEIAFDKDALARFEARAREVTSTEAFAAAGKELETRKKSIAEKEDTVMKIMEEREVLEKKAAQLEADFAGVGKKYDEQEKELEAQNAEVDQKTLGLRQQREAMAKAIDKSLLARYEQIFKRREGSAIVAVRGEVCQGCDMGVPPQIANFVRSGEQGVQTCPHCSRILVWEPREAPAEAPAKPKRTRKKKADAEDDGEPAEADKT